MSSPKKKIQHKSIQFFFFNIFMEKKFVFETLTPESPRLSSKKKIILFLAFFSSFSLFFFKRKFLSIFFLRYCVVTAFFFELKTLFSCEPSFEGEKEREKNNGPNEPGPSW